MQRYTAYRRKKNRKQAQTNGLKSIVQMKSLKILLQHPPFKGKQDELRNIGYGFEIMMVN